MMGVKVGGFPLMFRMASVGEAPTEEDATLEQAGSRCPGRSLG